MSKRPRRPQEAPPTPSATKPPTGLQPLGHERPGSLCAKACDSHQTSATAATP